MFKLPHIFPFLKHTLTYVNDGETGLLSMTHYCKLESECTLVKNVLEPRLLHYPRANIDNLERASFALFLVPNISILNLNLGTVD